MEDATAALVFKGTLTSHRSRVKHRESPEDTRTPKRSLKFRVEDGGATKFALVASRALAPPPPPLTSAKGEAAAPNILLIPVQLVAEGDRDTE